MKLLTRHTLAAAGAQARAMRRAVVPAVAAPAAAERKPEARATECRPAARITMEPEPAYLARHRAWEDRLGEPVGDGRPYRF